MRITAQLIIHCILPIDGIDGEGRIERMSPKGIKKKPSKSFNQDFPTAFYYHYQRVISIIVTSIIYIKIVGKRICIYSMIQCLMHEHTTHAQSILCFDIIYLQVCSFYSVASQLYINQAAKLRILLRINKFLYIKMKSHIKMPPPLCKVLVTKVNYLFGIKVDLVQSIINSQTFFSTMKRSCYTVHHQYLVFTE